MSCKVHQVENFNTSDCLNMFQPFLTSSEDTANNVQKHFACVVNIDCHKRISATKNPDQSEISFIHSSYTVLLRCRGFHFSLDLYTIGRISWTSDQPVARPVPKYRTTQAQNKRAHTPNIHVLSGIRTHDHSVRASEDSSWLRPLGYRERPD
jgi:hypothetical protein